MRQRSIRLRLLAIAIATVAVTLSAAGGVLVYLFERHIERRLGLELEHRWTELASVFTLDALGRPGLQHEPADARYQQPYGGVYYAVTAGDKPELRSRSLWDIDLPQQETARALSIGEPVEIDGPNDTILYILAKPLKIAHPDGERSYVLSVAIDHAEIDGLAREFAGDVGFALAAIAALLSIGAWVQLGVGLAPLATVRTELDRIRRGDGERMTGAFPEEIAPLVDGMNALLDRQDDLIKRARDRAGTLAHGLKTPLTIIHAEARRLQRAGAEETAATLRDQVEAMNRHIERELSRARIQGHAVAGSHALDVGVTVSRIVDLQRRMGRGGEIAWEVDIPAGLALRMDPGDFGEVVGNLLDNARKWASASVRIAARVDGIHARFTIEDDGPGIPEAMRRDVMARGVRAGSEEIEGSGLGLAIVSDVLGEYDSALSIETGPDGRLAIGFAVEGRIIAPAASAAARAHSAETDRPRRLGSRLGERPLPG